MPVSICQLQQITSLEQFYDEITRQLHLPAHFGRNLDALYDSLSADVRGPYEIVWRDTEQSRHMLGVDLYATLLEILQSVAEERGDVTLDIHH
ncbi:barstar family protein [Aquitalea denitrificans]|uniref:barstar family protein n=1 Tax=Aquitalea denitrificans TaxID=519081 RepID=UPI001F1062E6|nr:barstar family protein [Aquitalea denitrificans]